MPVADTALYCTACHNIQFVAWTEVEEIGKCFICRGETEVIPCPLSTAIRALLLDWKKGRVDYA